MKDFIEYIEASCAGLPNNQITYLFKKKILDEMTDRANEITHAGLKNEKVLADLMADEYPNLPEQYRVWAKEYKKKKLAGTRRLVMGIGGVIFFIAMFIAYFGVSDLTGAWRETWPIIMAGLILMFVADIIFAFVTRQKFRTVTTFVYMPVISTMLYIILAAYGIIGWGTGWPVILLGLLADLIGIICIAIGNAKYFMYKKEDDE